MQQLSCNSIPDCHTRPICDPPVHTHNMHPNVNYCVVPAKCVTNNGQIVSTDLMYCHNNPCDPDPCHANPNHSTQKYITKTAKSYRVSPIKNGSVGFLVEKDLPFASGQSISCNILGNESNYFNGIVFDYDAETGFLSIGAIDNVTGNFSNSVVYNINLILFDPEVVKLKQRMDYLYKYLFQIELNATPNFNPVSEQLQFFDKKIYNLILYLFNRNMRTDNDYELTELYLSNKVNDLYEYFFDVKLDRNLDFNANGFEGILLNNLKIKIYQIYIYLFSINLEQSPWFNPNTTNN